MAKRWGKGSERECKGSGLSMCVESVKKYKIQYKTQKKSFILLLLFLPAAGVVGFLGVGVV
jgi:hypothetical protein